MRYSRQSKLKFIPEDFQKNIKSKSLVIIGCGGIGSVLGELLVRGGFLNLILVDNDIIDETNLQRQIYFEEDIGKTKVKTLKEYLIKINSNAKIKTVTNVLDKKNIVEICKNADLIVDATDNFKTRRVINEYCEKSKKNWLYNGAVKTEIVSCLFRGEDRIFSKVFNTKIEEKSCCEIGILTSTTFSAASLAYNQVIKYFLNIKENKLIKLDLWTNKLHEVRLK